MATTGGTFTDMTLEEQLKGFVQENERVLRDICLSPEDQAYFEGKKFAYECVLELIQESK